MTELEKLLEEAKSDFCDNYCEWPNKYSDMDDLIEEKCQFCPFVRLI